ncbi:UNKNOWN [Stylonychia lemnae]|uniref:Uncharacterized protein n=1 Tax=Stylonychia lemnae TaxID=5949 RepID=A0A078AMF9_STYLE|nr:UNKNOWN [Stylonychia lemnae]|eukprot:CDW82577.1 UNKNOWN [Stylonychia lemnae]
MFYPMRFDWNNGFISKDNLELMRQMLKNLNFLPYDEFTNFEKISSELKSIVEMQNERNKRYQLKKKRDLNFKDTQRQFQSQRCQIQPSQSTKKENQSSYDNQVNQISSKTIPYQQQALINKAEKQIQDGESALQTKKLSLLQSNDRGNLIKNRVSFQIEQQNQQELVELLTETEEEQEDEIQNKIYNKQLSNIQSQDSRIDICGSQHDQIPNQLPQNESPLVSQFHQTQAVTSSKRLSSKNIVGSRRATRNQKSRNTQSCVSTNEKNKKRSSKASTKEKKKRLKKLKDQEITTQELVEEPQENQQLGQLEQTEQTEKIDNIMEQKENDEEMRVENMLKEEDNLDDFNQGQVAGKYYKLEFNGKSLLLLEAESLQNIRSLQIKYSDQSDPRHLVFQESTGNLIKVGLPI